MYFSPKQFEALPTSSSICQISLQTDATSNNFQAAILDNQMFTSDFFFFTNKSEKKRCTLIAGDFARYKC